MTIWRVLYVCIFDRVCGAGPAARDPVPGADPVRAAGVAAVPEPLPRRQLARLHPLRPRRRQPSRRGGAPQGGHPAAAADGRGTELLGTNYNITMFRYSNFQYWQYYY